MFRKKAGVKTRLPYFFCMNPHFYFNPDGNDSVAYLIPSSKIARKAEYHQASS
jgi:hypothetical protein